MYLLLVSFLAGLLSVLAPCVLPVLPVILWGSLWTQRRRRPLLIILSTWICIVLFTVLLKISTIFINVPPQIWTSISAIIIILYGITLLRPNGWEHFQTFIWLHNANKLLDKATTHTGVRWDILLGASLGPVFASCSPTYAILLSTVFPQSIRLGIGYTLVYAFGFCLLLSLIAYGGRAVVKKLRRAANPYGWFKKVLWLLLILTGILIASGTVKKLETALLDSGFWDATKLEQKLLQWFDASDMTGQVDQQLPSDSANSPWLRALNAHYVAPEFSWLENRLNTSGRSSLQELRGKVVIIDFRTYSCINCIRTLPYLKKLYETYVDDGLVIIGVHAPEFQFERVLKNVQKAVEEYGLTYPVVQDNTFTTRRAYNNHYWPAKYIIDKDGYVRYTHFGEGNYEETEQVVQALLWIDQAGVLEETWPSSNASKTPETYLWTERRARFSDWATDRDHARWLWGTRWDEPEKIVSLSSGAAIFLNAVASEVHLVMGSNWDQSVSATVLVDGNVYTTFQVSEKTLYTLFQNIEFGSHAVEIHFDQSWVEAYAFTFW